MRRYKAFIPLLAILSAMALMFSVIGGRMGHRWIGTSDMAVSAPSL